MIKNVLAPVRSAFQVELPECDTMEEYLDAILPKLTAFHEPLAKEGFLNVRWLEVREEDDHFSEVILHIFCPGNEYLIVVDGNISKGTWKILPGDETFILEVGGRRELYDCALNHDDFLILKKHGNQQRLGQPKYFFLGREAAIQEMEWTDCLQTLFDLYAGNAKFMSYLFVAGLLLLIVLYFSLG